MIQRVKSILLSPKTEWNKINEEKTTMMEMFTKYVLILAAIPAVCSLLGWGVIGYRIFGYSIKGFDLGIKYAIIVYAAIIAAFFAGSYIVDALAPTFKSQKDINKSSQLVGYGLIPMCIGGVFFIFPNIMILGILLGLGYAGYILFLGIGILKPCPEDQKMGYLIVSILACAVAGIIVHVILQAILFQGGIYGLGMGGF